MLVHVCVHLSIPDVCFLVKDTFIILIHHFRDLSMPHLLVMHLSQPFFESQCGLTQEHRVRENQGHSITCSKDFCLCEGWNLTLRCSFGVNTHSNISSRTSHFASFTISSLMALKCCFTKPLCEINMM